MSRALIIGHSGQDGRILWDQLAARGYALLGISRTGFRCQGIDWVQPVDVGDLDDLCALVREVRPSQAYYLAAHHHSSQEPGVHVDDVWRRSWAVHVHGLQHLLEAVRTGSPECRTFYAASSRIFGAGDGSLVDEGAPRRPEDAYGVTKAAGMLVAEHYRRTHGQFVSCGILFNHESPLRGEQFVTQRVVKTRGHRPGPGQAP